MNELRELDRVRLLADIEADEGVAVSTGSIGTVVAIWAGGEAFEVEFTEPFEALATIPSDILELVDRVVDQEAAEATFLASDLPWLAPGSKEAFTSVPECLGRADGEISPPVATNGEGKT